MPEYNFSHFAVSPCGGQTRENDKKEAPRSSRLSGHWKSTLIKTHRHGERESSAAAAPPMNYWGNMPSFARRMA